MSLARAGIQSADLPHIAGPIARVDGGGSVPRDDQIEQDAANFEGPRLSIAPPAQLRISVFIDRPDLHSAILRRNCELDVPVRRIDPLDRSGSEVERREIEMLAVVIGDHRDPIIGEPTRRHVLDVLAMSRDLADAARTRIDDEQVLRGVVKHPHHEELAAGGRPPSHDVPRRTGQEDALSGAGGIDDDYVHIHRRARVRRERDGSAVG